MRVHLISFVFAANSSKKQHNAQHIIQSESAEKKMNRLEQVEIDSRGTPISFIQNKLKARVEPIVVDANLPKPDTGSGQEGNKVKEAGNKGNEEGIKVKEAGIKDNEEGIKDNEEGNKNKAKQEDLLNSDEKARKNDKPGNKDCHKPNLAPKISTIKGFYMTFIPNAPPDGDIQKKNHFLQAVNCQEIFPTGPATAKTLKSAACCSKPSTENTNDNNVVDKHILPYRLGNCVEDNNESGGFIEEVSYIGAEVFCNQNDMELCTYDQIADAWAKSPHVVYNQFKDSECIKSLDTKEYWVRDRDDKACKAKEELLVERCFCSEAQGSMCLKGEFCTPDGCLPKNRKKVTQALCTKYDALYKEGGAEECGSDLMLKARVTALAGKLCTGTITCLSKAGHYCDGETCTAFVNGQVYSEPCITEKTAHDAVKARCVEGSCESPFCIKNGTTNKCAPQNKYISFYEGNTNDGPVVSNREIVVKDLCSCPSETTEAISSSSIPKLKWPPTRFGKEQIAQSCLQYDDGNPTKQHETISRKCLPDGNGWSPPAINADGDKNSASGVKHTCTPHCPKERLDSLSDFKSPDTDQLKSSEYIFPATLATTDGKKVRVGDCPISIYYYQRTCKIVDGEPWKGAWVETTVAELQNTLPTQMCPEIARCKNDKTDNDECEAPCVLKTKEDGTKHCEPPPPEKANKDESTTTTTSNKCNASIIFYFFLLA